MNFTHSKQYFIALLFTVFHWIAFSQQLVSRPFAGHISTTEINGWCMFRNAGQANIRLSTKTGKLIDEKHFEFQSGHCFRHYLPVVFRFDSLSSSQSYSLSYSFDRQNYHPLIDLSTRGDSLADLTFLAGSCAFIGTGFNGILKPFNNLQIFEHMKNDTADMMLWLGDNLYYVFDYKNYKGQLKRNIKTRLNKKLSALLASKQNYAIWDDHDYGSNNSDGSFKEKTSSLDVFRQFWPNPEPKEGSNYYSFRQQDCSFFMLDDRYNNEQEAVVLGQSQLAWLEQQLLSSDATFKFICIGMQALNPLSTMECFYKTKTEYRELVDFIRSHHIHGVLFISGDRHHGELMKVEEPGLYPLYDLTTSPLTMYPIHLSAKSPEYYNPYKVSGTYYPSYNYAKIRVSGPEGKRVCTLVLKDRKGKTVWSYTIRAEELQQP